MATNVANNFSRFLTDPNQKFSFPEFSTSSFVEVNTSIPNLTSFTVCVWSKVIEHAQLYDGLFIYTAPLHLTSDCDDITFGAQSSAGFILSVKNLNNNYQYVQVPNQWTHLCVAWENNLGNLSLFVNGSHMETKPDINKRETIFGNGNVILGLEMDRDAVDQKCNKGDIRQSYKGEITHLYMWNKTLTEKEIQGIMAFEPLCEGLILDWKCVIQERRTFGNVTLETFDKERL